MDELNSRIGYNLYKTGMLMRREGLRFLKKYGITPEQWQVMMVLSKHKEQTQKQICECTIQDAPTMSRTIERMIKSGLVDKKKSSKDRRAAVICLSSKGEKLVKKMLKQQKFFSRLDGLMKGFSDKKKIQLIGLLKELRSCLEGECVKNKKNGGYHD